MSDIHGERLRSLRNEIRRNGLDGFIIPLADEHLSEYVGEYAKRLAWLTGFRGSAGVAVVLSDRAAIFVDGRYTLQVRQEVDSRQWTFHNVPQATPVTWLVELASSGARVGYDPWVHSKLWVEETRSALRRGAVELIAVDSNPIDAVWSDRPAPSEAPVIPHPNEVAGRSAGEKLGEIAKSLTRHKANAVVLTGLDSVAWALNIRGSDIRHTPVALAFAVVHRDETVDLFVSEKKLTRDVRDHLGALVRTHARTAFTEYMGGLAGKRVMVDPKRAVAAIFQCLDDAGADIVEARDPVMLPKATKNSAEIGGARAAHIRDGLALTRFLHWVATTAPHEELDELSAAARMRALREETGLLRDLAFDTISAVGPNAALAHYQPTPQTCRPLSNGTLYLIDSGGQYLDGTTDVTRTVAIGVPSPKMRENFTLALKGHIAVAQALFPLGTRGTQLDPLARQFLWAAGRDFAHGTGHGVGSYLGVHEGPQRISKPAPYFNLDDEPLAPGMIVSNEPGYYRPGEYGLRIENLMVVIEIDAPDAEFKMLGFEMLTMAPLDRTLVNCALLTMEERAWVDRYHAMVADTLAPRLEYPVREWLLSATRPLQ